MLQQCRLKPRQGFSVSHFGWNLIIAVEGWGRKHHSPRGDLRPNHVRSGEGNSRAPPDAMHQTSQEKRHSASISCLATRLLCVLSYVGSLSEMLGCYGHSRLRLWLPLPSGPVLTSSGLSHFPWHLFYKIISCLNINRAVSI